LLSAAHHSALPSLAALSTSAMTTDNGVDRIARKKWRIAMKTIISGLIALSVLAGIAGPATALDTKTFYDQQDRGRY
jgi:hypothetical protein